ncbi:MAG: tetratricopeptide repeat protein [Chloroflexaceae bacterium]
MDNQLGTAMPAMVALLLDEGARLWLEGALIAAQTHLERAFEVAENIGSAAGRLGAMQLLASLAFTRGDLEECYALHSAVLNECRALCLDIGVASSLHNLGLVAARRGDFETARGMIIAAINVYTVIGRRDAAAAARANLQRLAGQ